MPFETTEPSTPAPLTGIRVVEIGNFMAGPFCTMQLADLGADVVKVENPAGGDMTRQGGPFIGGESSSFIRLNRNKRSLALDLKSEAGRQAVHRLLAHSDILVENLRPGTLTKLGFGYDDLTQRYPALIYLSASGWGQDGPYAERPGLDIMAQGMSGLMSITGEERGEPVKIGVPIADLASGLYGALAVVAALYARNRSGRGQFLDISLFESAVSLAVWEAGQYFGSGEIPHRHGSAHQTNAPYQAFPSSDGSFTAGAITPKNWTAFCRVLGLEDLEADPRFRQNHLRREHLDELIPLITAVTKTRSSAFWVTQLEEAGVPCGVIQTFDQVFNDPHLLARRFFVDAPHATLGPVRQVASPMRFSETSTQIRRAGPVLGEHTAEILAEAGYGRDEIDAILASGAALDAKVHA